MSDTWTRSSSPGVTHCRTIGHRLKGCHVISAIIGFWYMVIGHFVADYPLQTEFISEYKNPRKQGRVPWYYVMLSHALVHGAFVSVATGLALGHIHILFPVILGIFETIIHFCLDVLKCINCTSIHTDQLVHILCKVAWTLSIVFWINNGLTYGFATASIFACLIGSVIFCIAYRHVRRDTGTCKSEEK
jgi:ABC-type Mn2+/Zn2+ transport system permease subunit